MRNEKYVFDYGQNLIAHSQFLSYRAVTLITFLIIINSSFTRFLHFIRGKKRGLMSNQTDYIPMISFKEKRKKRVCILVETYLNTANERRKKFLRIC